MRIKLLYIFITLAANFVFTSITYAQPPDDRGVRGNDGKTYGERDIERTAANTAKPNAGGQQWSFDQNALNNLVEQWKRNSLNYVSPQQKAAMTQVSKELAAAQQKRQSIINELEQEIKTFGRPYKELLHRSGFVSSSMELNHIIEGIVFNKDSYDKSKTEKLTQLIKKFCVAKQAFEAAKESASVEVLLSYVASYLPAWETSLMDLNYLSKKFPNATGQIDTLKFYTVGYCLGMNYEGLSYGGFTSSPLKNYLQDYMVVTVFQPLADKYPDLAMQVAAQTKPDGAFQERNPYLILADFYNVRKDKENYEKHTKYLKLALLTPYKSGEGLKNDGMMSRFPGDELFYQSFSVDDWKKFSKIQNRTISQLFTALFNSGTDVSILLPPRYYRNINKGSNKKYVKDYGEAKVLSALAEEGNVDAMNLLGVYYIWGKLKGGEKKGVEMLRTAATKGSVTARFNLIFATPYEIKGNDLKNEEQAFINFFSQSTKAEVVQAINLLNRFDTSYGWERDLARLISTEMRTSLNTRSIELHKE